MWQIRESIVVNADKVAVWKIWSAPQSWPSWDEEVKSCKLNGDFKAGTTGVLAPKGGPAVKFILTEVTPFTSFTDVANLPLAKLSFEHVMREVKSGQVEVVHTVKITGMLAWFFSRVMGKQIAKGLPKALKNLAAQAEAKCSLAA